MDAVFRQTRVQFPPAGAARQTNRSRGPGRCGLHRRSCSVAHGFHGAVRRARSVFGKSYRRNEPNAGAPDPRCTGGLVLGPRPVENPTAQLLAPQIQTWTLSAATDVRRSAKAFSNSDSFE